MTDRELLLRKLDAIRHHAGRLRTKLPGDADALVADEDLRDILSNNLSQAVQAAFDVAAHVISHLGTKVPDTYAEGFELLAQHHLIDSDLSKKLILAAGLRNRLQHRYQAIDWVRVHASIRDGVADFDSFVAAMRVYLDSSSAAG